MENLLSFFEEASEPFWIIDQNYALIYGNKSFFIAAEETYGRKIHKFDNIFNLSDIGSEAYVFWKNCYDKAFLYETFSADRVSSRRKTKTIVHYDFRVIHSFVKFLCIRGIIEEQTEEIVTSAAVIAQSNELLVIVDEDGEVIHIPPSLKHVLGYFTEWPAHTSIMDFLHPEEKELLCSFVKSDDTVKSTWCRVRDVNGKYFWCNVQVAVVITEHQVKHFNILVNEIRQQKATVDYLVPDVNLLKVIAQAQWVYISTGSVKQAFEVCLHYFKTEGISPFSFVASLNWKGTQPFLQVVASEGTWPQAEEYSIDNLLTYLSSYCLEIQQAINTNESQPVNNGYYILFDQTDFMLYLLIQNSELVGVLATTHFSYTGRNTAAPQVIPLVAYFRPLFVSILQSNKFSINAQDALNKLVQNKDELQSLVASLDDMILEVNTEYMVVNLWSKDETLLPSPHDLIKGKKIKDIWQGELGIELEEIIASVLESGVTRSLEFRFPVNDELVWLEAKVNLVRIYSGEKRVTILVHDITPKKHAEAAIAEALNKEKELNEMKSRMITSISHEFRTPLATIISCTELVEMYVKKHYSDVNDRTQEMFDTVYDEVERLSEMMKSFLVMGRLEENQTPFRPKLVDVEKTIKRIIRTNFHLQYGDEKIKITVINNSRPAEIDPILFWHIISNIISNAVKYSPQEQPVEVQVRFEEDYFTISVTDRGIGIPENELPNIFQSFYRASNSDEHSGYGLGLAIVERFVNMHQATITVRSTLGKGCTFILAFNYTVN
ncbi:hypothetical protein F5148DRAFT_1307831 [Russula earlei]|uniref:Uncharacterized protein n=1 Tax=Russula earlei TaxID=71964 RepID=A0ACC0TSB6_9AGAM|nr:hypothetical protein F5148DRAFT_1307831 [Russula earlei]